MKPLAFSRPMVLARRAGRKTQTRRLVRGQIPNSEFRIPNLSGCPYGQPGDPLWVREDFQFLATPLEPLTVRYLADGATAQAALTEHEFALFTQRQFPYRRTPGRFMYQSLARDRPTLLSVRIERLQDLTEADALAEGLEPDKLWDRTSTATGRWTGFAHTHDSPVAAFAELWTHLHGPESWAANPWVWVLELTQFQP